VTNRILVTGGKGMMGTDLCRILGERGCDVVCTDIEEMDVRQPDLIMKRLAEVQPRVVVHLAALTDVDGCERDPDAAYQTNALGTQNVAWGCHKLGLEMVYVSTLSVFSGDSERAYTEFDEPDPRSWYSRAKHVGERFVRELVPRHYVARAGWMFGGGVRDKKFVGKIIQLARERPELKVVDDKFGSPTYTADISLGIARLIDTGFYGTYHMVNTGPPVSRFDLATEILAQAQVAGCRIVPVSSAEFPLPAPRPRMEAGRNYQLELRGLDWMRPWRQALSDYVARWLSEERTMAASP